MRTSGVEGSSPIGTTVFARREPLSFLNLEPSFDGPTFPLTEAGRGTVSTLVVVDTRVGVDIWLGLTRLRMDPVCLSSGRLTFEGFLLSASIAASAFCCTSRVSSASSWGVWGILGVEGFRV